MFDFSGRDQSQQLKRVRHYRKSADTNRFIDLLSDDAVSDKIESLLPKYRDRLYTPTQTLSLFLTQALNDDRSCQCVVNEWFVARQAAGLDSISTNTAAYCSARQRLPTSLVRELVRHSGQELQQRTAQPWKWKERCVKLVDGTTLSMPDTEENQEKYPQPKTQQPGVGFPQCRVVGILDLSTGGVIDVAFSACKGKGSGEQALLRQLLDSSLNAGEVLVGDAFYPSYFLLWTLQMMGVDFLGEQMGARARSTDFRRGESLGACDHLISYDKPDVKPDWLSQAEYDEAPETLCVREFRCKGGKNGKKTKTLVTTMCCPKQYKKSELKQLYKQRWQIEINFRHIKTTLGMDVLSCKTPEMVEKEIWVYLLAYNLIRILMAQAAFQAARLPNTLSFKHCAQLWLAWGRTIQSNDEANQESLLSAIAQKRVGNRPDRIEPRQRKRRPKPYPVLKESRHQARKKVVRYGHESKLAA